jgi:hypothetical protein
VIGPTFVLLRFPDTTLCRSSSAGTRPVHGSSVAPSLLATLHGAAGPWAAKGSKTDYEARRRCPSRGTTVLLRDWLSFARFRSERFARAGNA